MDVKNKDLLECQNEPIHIPGSIQSFGALVSFNAEFEVQHYSENLFDLLALSSPEDVSEWLRRNLNAQLLTSEFPFDIKESPLEIVGRLHFNEEVYILELEKKTNSRAGLAIHLQKTVQSIQAASSIEEMFDCGVRGLKEISGYDKVMLYKFHPDEHGEVIAEACQEGNERFLGLHYPATDIPPQARSIFLQNWVRMIPDIESPVIPIIAHGTTSPLNLGKAVLRTSSPIHLEYLRNMKVKGSLTTSIILEGRLWGLVAYHQYSSPRYCNQEMRLCCEVIGRLLSAELTVRLERDLQQKREKTLSLETIQGEDPLRSLFSSSHLACELLPPDVKGAAAYYEGKWLVEGSVPSLEDLNSLVTFIDNNLEGDIFITDSLQRLFQQWRSSEAAGVLAIPLNKEKKEYLLWFKPELVQVLKWAGDPEKKVEVIDGRIHPRKSFELYLEEVKFKSASWDTFQQEQALKIRSLLLDHELHRSYIKEKAARELLEEQKVKSIYSAKMASLGEIASGVAHELNNPLAIIASSCMRLESELSNFDKDIDGIHNIIKSLNSTTLRISKIVRGLNFFVSDRTPGEKRHVLLSHIISEVQSIVSPRFLKTDCQFNLVVDSGLELMCRPVDIAQVILNLLNNSLDALENSSERWISLQARKEDENIIIELKDSGAGINKNIIDKIMDPFFTTRAAGKGSGLGLTISHMIMEEHGGSLELVHASGPTWFRLILPSKS